MDCPPGYYTTDGAHLVVNGNAPRQVEDFTSMFTDNQQQQLV